MRVIHTSDWHLGCKLYGKKRYAEFEQYLEWLALYIKENDVDILLLSGDVFDTKNPSNSATELYYNFLVEIPKEVQVVVIAGNHDSPSFLNSPKGILKRLNTDVICSISQNIEDEVLLLKNKENEPLAVICAVPYLRDRDVRLVEAGESFETKNQKLIAGIRDHYERVLEQGKELQKATGEIPLIGMGHLFTAGGKVTEGDGVRDLYIGNLAQVGSDLFLESYNYVALGHLHVAQKVGKSPFVRYSGSPIPMGFGEAKQKKIIIQIDFVGVEPTVKEVEVPRFQELQSVTGTLAEITSALQMMKMNQSNCWVEVEYNGEDLAPNLKREVEEAIVDSDISILKIKNSRLINNMMPSSDNIESLDKLDVYEVFTRCLESNNITGDSQKELMLAYKEIIISSDDNDENSE